MPLGPAQTSRAGAQPLRVQVLIVEDNRPDVFLLKLAIAREYPHCDFHVVETGQDAFRFLRRDFPYVDAVTPDLVVLDLNLPFKTGQEVLDLIRGTEQLRKTAVVLCSSSPRDPRVRSPFGPDAYIAKPADLDSYLALGKEIMGCFWRKRTPEGFPP
jgi:CheY-like chemotaxis protein